MQNFLHPISNEHGAKVITRGFTIIELLIVIVVIGILAAITIVAYAGIQNRAKTGSNLSMAEMIIKKSEAANVLIGHYPSSISDFELNKETSLVGTGVIFSSGTLDGTQSLSTVLYSSCAIATPTGAKIRYYDYSAGAIVNTNIGTLTAPCAILSGGPY